MTASLTRPDHKTLSSATAETIENAIQEGTFPPGSQLPPEFELIDMLGVSRTTLREALKSLETRRIIVRKRGRGTFVNEKPIVKDLSMNFGISEMISQAGFTPGARDAKAEIVSANAEQANALDIKQDEPAIRIERLHTANEIPVVWSIDIVPRAIFNNQIPNGTDLNNLSLYDYFTTELQLRILHGEATIRPELTSKDIASKLDINVGDPVLVITQIDYSDDDRPVLFSIEYHLADQFVFFIMRKGPSW